jgi:transcriptional regulator with XRE-family HTH domain
MYPNLKLHMWRSGVRQNRLAQILEMDETALSRIVNGFRRPGLKRRIAIAPTNWP